MSELTVAMTVVFCRSAQKMYVRSTVLTGHPSILAFKSYSSSATAMEILGAKQLQRVLDLGQERLDLGTFVRAGIGFEPRQ